jgi:trehalose-6-phosphate hydrolase
LIALRNKEKLLQYGNYEQLSFANEQISFIRALDADKITVVINFGKEKKIAVPPGAVILMGNARLKQNNYIVYRTKSLNR